MKITPFGLRIMNTTFGFMWNCKWEIEWRNHFEYWDRSTFGPFYILLRKKERSMVEQDNTELPEDFPEEDDDVLEDEVEEQENDPTDEAEQKN